MTLRGARQVGKSTLVRQFAQAAKLRLVEINLEKNLKFHSVFETVDAGKIISAIEADLKTKLDPDKTLIFFDEIQACPQAIVALRYFYEDHPQFKVVAAGSLLEFALTDNKLSMPVGRVTYQYLGPLCLEEFLLATGEEFLLATGEDYLLDRLKTYELGHPWPETLHQHFLTSLRTYLMVGGMPEVVQAFIDGATYTQFRSLQQNLIAIYADDFSKYATKTELARPLTEGMLAEQFVAQELLFPDESPIKPKLHYWLREGKKGAAEVDFLIQKSSQIIPIEVKSGKIGKIKSLLYMLGLKKLQTAIRISADLPAYVRYSHIISIEGQDIEVKFKLFECPPYLVGVIRRLSFQGAANSID